MKNQIEILEVPKTFNENVSHNALMVAKLIGTDITDNDIVEVSRAT